MQQEIINLIKKAIKNLQVKKVWSNFEISEIILERPKNLVHGDWTTNLAFQLAKELQKSPMQIADELAKELNNDEEIKSNFEEIKSVAGYINFSFSQKYLQNLITKINQEKENFGNLEINKGKKINNEFISANPTGPLHLGNGRGGFLGDVISKVLRKTGAEVLNEYYVNDAGEQVLKLAHSVLKDENLAYQGEYIDELNEDLAKNFNKEEKQDLRKIGFWASEEILEKHIKKTLQEKMKINFNSWISERKDIVETEKIELALDILRKKNLIYEKEGAVWLETTKFGDDKDRVLIKKNGEKTYFASDCGYILSKMERGFTDLIEIWGADHHGYIARFQAVVKALDFSGSLKFVIVQLVRLMKDGKEVRMSKRAGNVVFIDELIDEVGIDATRFFFLMYSADSHLDFDLSLAKEKSNKNPVFYVQYAYARICSILRKNNLNLEKVELNLFLLNNKKEIELLRVFNEFSEIIKEVGENYNVHKIPQYAIRLADKFHSFYNECSVIDEKNLSLSLARLELLKSTQIILKNTLDLIGISAPEEM